jgi:hypothetical protein
MAFTKGRVSGGNTPNSTKDQRENLVNSSKVILDLLHMLPAGGNCEDTVKYFRKQLQPELGLYAQEAKKN